MRSEASIEVAARRLNRVVWAVGLAALALIAVRVLQGCWPNQWPGQDLLPRLPREADALEFNAIVMAVAYVALSLLIAPKLLLVLLGRPWLWRTPASRPLAQSSVEAQETAERAFARLIDAGWTVEPTEPLPDGGWRMRARRARRSLVDSPLAAPQSVEFEWRPSGAVVRHRFRRAVDWFERGEREYQEWLFARLTTGGTLSVPPRCVSGALWGLTSGAFLAGTGAVLQVMPESLREPWVLPHAIVLIAGVVVALLGPLSRVFERRYTTGKRMAVPGLALLLCGVFFWFARQDEWQSEVWRTSDDPRVLCRAAASADRDIRPSMWPRIMTARDERATDARQAIERRLVALGPCAVPALLELWEREVLVNFPDVVLRRMGPRATSALLAALESRDAGIRMRAIWALKHVRRETGVRGAVEAHLRDAPIIDSAIEFFDQDDAPWSDSVGAAITSLVGESSRAVRAVGRRRWRPAVPALVEALARDSFDSRPSEIYDALARIGEPAAIPALVARAGKRYGGAESALRELGAPGIEALLDLAEGPCGEEAVRALEGVHRDVELKPATIDRLIGMIDGPRRVVALRLLSHSRDERALARVAREIRADDGWRLLFALHQRGRVSRADAEFWREKKPGSLIPPLHDAETTGRPHVSKKLATAMLIRALTDPADGVQADAALALGELRSREAVDALIALVERRGCWIESRRDEAWVVHAAVRALGEIGDPRAIHLLRAVARRARWRGEVRGDYVAASALVMCGDREMVPRLRYALMSPLSQSG
jgi:HEAT repeat protein